MNVTFKENQQLGYYSIGEQKYYSKVQALVDASKLEQFPEWNFNRDTFDSFNWAEEPDVNLRELYKIRAKQLREKYDYIRLEFSGGGDSTTVLYSFVNNNIFLDEIVLRYPEKGSKDSTDDPFNYKAENTLSELKYAAGPTIKWLKLHSPNTKITIHDYSEDIIASDNHDENWIYQTQEYFEPSWVFKHRVDATTDHKKTLDRGLRVCILWGIDKPKVCIRDSKWYLYFLDKQANIVTEFTDIYNNVSNEYFYWSPELPELLCKQGHIVKNWFNLPHNKYLQHLVKWPNHSFTQRTTFEHIIKPLIYEDYDPSTFQVSKPTSNFYNEMDHWFYKNLQDTHTYRVWRSGLDYLVKNIDPKYFNYELKKPVGFIGFLSPFYYLGEANFVDTGINSYDRVW